MKVLILAPHPFYQERGTPIAVDLLAQALSERGDTVDLLTYHEGIERTYKNVRIHRIKRPVFQVRNIRPGPSFKKLICDFYIFAKLIRMLRNNRYDVIHAVEESAFMAMLLKPFFSVPFIYDIDSSMTEQIVDKYRAFQILRKPLYFLESLPARKAASVVAVCDALAKAVEPHCNSQPVVLKDVSLLDDNTGSDAAEDLRKALGITGLVTMYIGNLEFYQGIPLLIESFALAHTQADMPKSHLIIIGGEPVDIEYYHEIAQSFGVEDKIYFVGKRPVYLLGAYMRQANLLVSPRTRGVNTPMKIYSYLHSGVAVLATDLPTHTQVITGDIGYLTPAEPKAFAASLVELLQNSALRSHLAEKAYEYIEREHSYSAFKQTLYGVYEALESDLDHDVSESSI